MRKRILIAATVALLGLGASTARAQWVVVDPTNLVQNIVSAIENTKQVMNQITQISNEVQSLANQAQNLQSLPAGLAQNVLGQYTTQFGQLVAAMQSINGIAQNVATLTAKYNATFPNTALAQGPLSNAAMLSQLSGWLAQSRSVYQGAYNTQAQIIASLKADSGNLQTVLNQSGASHGALDAIEAGNQINGQMTAQIMKLNQQMAAINQAQLNWIAEQTQLLAQAQSVSQSQAVGFTAPSTAIVNPAYNRLH